MLGGGGLVKGIEVNAFSRARTADRKRQGRTREGEEKVVVVPSPLRRAQSVDTFDVTLQEMKELDTFVNTKTEKMVHGHPGASMLLPVVRGVEQRAKRTLKHSNLSSWVQFVDFDGCIYFYDFVSKTRTANFPVLQVAEVSYYPARQLEPSAQLLADAGEALIGDMPYPAALQKVKALMWEPQREARALVLAHNPCPVDEIVQHAQLIGMNAGTDYEFMWIVDAMLTPELPVGWLRKSTLDGGEYYWNSIVGTAQWEHPQTSFLTGVVRCLKRLREQSMALDFE